MEITISAKSAPSLGDVRALGPGDTVRLHTDYRQRPDWIRYLAAAAHAMARGARVVQGADHG
ncbi:hypothetical protein ACIOUE_38155 [Streptomyces xanthochromogenes]|uniref:hypothetical protein n=1 Tax=Streptomyces xanthochromogenes TaxID=67384 RepID=UPI003819E154